MQIIYFNEESEISVEFESDEISTESFYDDIMRIGAKTNPINPTQLFSKISDTELDNLLFTIQYRPELAKKLFYIKETSYNEYILTLSDCFMERVTFIGKNKDCSIMKIVNTSSGILQASNLFLERNLVKV